MEHHGQDGARLDTRPPFSSSTTALEHPGKPAPLWLGSIASRHEPGALTVSLFPVSPFIKYRQEIKHHRYPSPLVRLPLSINSSLLLSRFGLKSACVIAKNLDLDSRYSISSSVTSLLPTYRCHRCRYRRRSASSHLLPAAENLRFAHSTTLAHGPASWLRCLSRALLLLAALRFCIGFQRITNPSQAKVDLVPLHHLILVPKEEYSLFFIPGFLLSATNAGLASQLITIA